MIQRSMDVAAFNRWANDPHVRPFLGDGGDSELDLSPLVLNPSNICIATEHGGWILQLILPGGLYELHTLFLRSGRGKVFKGLAEEALHYAFTTTDLLELRTRCPDDNPAARMAAVWVGFRELWRMGGEPPNGTSFQTLNIDDWFVRDPLCWEEARRLRGALEVIGATWPTDEDVYAYAIGAAVAMARKGQVGKAVGFFSRWAASVGLPGITSPAPGILDIGAAVLDVEGGELRVLR